MLNEKELVTLTRSVNVSAHTKNLEMCHVYEITPTSPTLGRGVHPQLSLDDVLKDQRFTGRCGLFKEEQGGKNEWNRTGKRRPWREMRPGVRRDQSQ